MNRNILLIVFLIVAILGTAFAVETEKSTLSSFWNKGQAELTRYQLEQSRYGEIHKGEAVLIFVTEPFLQTKQVKFEGVTRTPDVMQVLKLNFTKKFFTGIYPYSMMTSVFTPFDPVRKTTLKVTSSSQEWCGQTYTQLNFRNNQYQALARSYFQEEGDVESTLSAEWLEDEIWTQIRLAPGKLPQGKIKIIPGLQYVRLAHQDLIVQQAEAKTEKAGDITRYSLNYPSLNRKLTIEFQTTFPHQITGWQETAPGGFSAGSKPLTTRAKKTHSLMLDYWNKHGVADGIYREKLGLTMK